jgi:hypothetical protein
LILGRKRARISTLNQAPISFTQNRSAAVGGDMNKMRYPGVVFTTLLLMMMGCEKSDSSANSQLTGKIIGRISDARTNLQIVGASISTNPSTEIVTSDSVGQFVISKIAAGRYTVTASKPGYTPGSVDVTVRSDTLSVADIKLSI